MWRGECPIENKISVHNLKKNFGKLEVLKDISIEIREGEVVCMIGPSGSGKSTFLRCLNRLEKITSGLVSSTREYFQRQGWVQAPWLASLPTK